MTVDGKFPFARSLTSCPRVGLAIICCLATTAAKCPVDVKNSHVIAVAEFHPVADNITRVKVVDELNLRLKKCNLVEKNNKILHGDEDSTFWISDDGLLHLNSSLNHTRKQLYTLEIGLFELWKVGGDKTFVTIAQTACIEICVCPGKSTVCEKGPDLLSTASPVKTSPSARTLVPSSSSVLVSDASGPSGLTSIPTSGSSTPLPVQSTGTDTPQRVLITSPTTKEDYRQARFTSQYPVSDIEDQLFLAIVLAATVLAVAVLIILLMACQLYKKSSKRCCVRVESAPVSADDIEMPQKRERSPTYEHTEPPPDSELFYYYYAEMDSEVEAPGFVSSNRRELYHIRSNHNWDMHSRRYGDANATKDRLGVSTCRESSDKTAEWVDEQRRITERRTSMPTALDDVSVESKADEVADCLPEFSVMPDAHPHPSHAVRVNLLADANFVLTNPLVKLSIPQVPSQDRQRRASTSSLTCDRVRHGSNYGSPDRPLPPVEDLS